MRSPIVFLVAGWILAVLAPKLLAQAGSPDPTAGRVQGRLLSAFGMGPVSGARLELTVPRGDRRALAAEAQSDPQGRFSIASGHLPREARLTIKAAGFAPRVLPLRETPFGAGLLLGDLILDQGAKLTVRLAEGLPEGFEASAASVLLYGLADEDDEVDLDLPPLADARFDANGAATLPQVPAGPCALVIGDGFSRVAPRVVFWRMGRGDAVLPPIRLEEGRKLQLRARTTAAGPVIADLRLPGGVWRPEGGREIALRRRARARALGGGLHELVVAHVVPGVVEARFESRGQSALVEAVPGFDFREIALVDDLILRGRVVAEGTRRRIEGAVVRVGSRSVVSDDEGRFTLGIPVDAPLLEIVADDHARLEGEVLLAEALGSSRIREFTLVRGAALVGSIRDGRDEPKGGAYVAVDDPPNRAYGLRVVARSDASGAFRAPAVLEEGAARLFALTSDEDRGAAESERVTAGAHNEAILACRPGARGKGRIDDFRGRPIAGIDVYLVDTKLGYAALYDPGLATRRAAPVVAHVLTDREGVYRFDGLPPGRYRVMTRARDRAPFLSEAFSLGEGENFGNLIWRLPESFAARMTIPADRAVRLVPDDPELPEIHVARYGESPPPDLVEYPPGAWTATPLHFGDEPPTTPEEPGAWPGEGREGARRFRLPGEPAVTFDAYPRHRLEGRILLGGDAPDRRPLAALLVPVGAPVGFTPLRLDVEPIRGSFEVDLPRGVYVVHVFAPEHGETFSPPIGVGLDVGRGAATEVLVDVPASARVVGRLEAAPEDLLHEGGLTIAFRPFGERATAPFAFRRPARRSAPDGNFDLAGVPAGGCELRVVGRRLGARVEMHLESFGFAEPGAIALETGPIPASERPAFGAIDAEIWRFESETAGREGRGDLVRRAVAATAPRRPIAAAPHPLPGELVVDEYGLRPGGDDMGPGRRDLLRRRWSFDSGSPSRGGGTLDGFLTVGGRRLVSWPFALVPLEDEAYRYGVAEMRRLTTPEGRLRDPGTDGGEWALHFEWEDDLGVLYRHRIPFSGSARRRERPDLKVATGRLEVVVQKLVGDGYVEGAVVRLHAAAWRGLMTGSQYRREHAVVAEARTDRSGTAIFAAVPLGHYDVKVRGEELGFGVVHDVTVATSVRAERAEVRLSAPGALGVTLRDLEGRPIPGGRVLLFDERDTEIQDDRIHWADGEGFVEIRGLAPGTYAVIGQGHRHPPRFLGEVDVPVGGRPIVDGVFGEPAILEVTVLDHLGKPFPGAKVVATGENPALALFDGAGRTEGEIPSRTDGAGRLVFSRFPAGAYRIDVRQPGFRPKTVEGSVEAGARAAVEVRLEKMSSDERTAGER